MNQRVGLRRAPGTFALGSSLLIGVLAAVEPFVNSCVSAEIQGVPNVTIRHVLVPSDKPHWWPKGNWNAIDAGDFRALINAAQPEQPRPPAAWIEHADYEATLVNNVLKFGRITAQVERLGEQDSLLTLDPCNLALSDLHWTDGDAVWGTDRQGATAVLVNRRRGRLEGSWSLSSREVPGSMDFDVRVAPATVSRITLLLPHRFHLDSSAGNVDSRPTEPGWTLWEIGLGSETACRLTLQSTPETPTDRHPLVYTERSSSYVLRQGGLSCQSDFNLEVVGGSVPSLTFRVAEGMTIHSVMYGSGYSLSPQPTGTHANREMFVPLPEPITGRGHRIRVMWTAPFEFNRPWDLPRITVEDSVYMDGQLNVTIEAPLELNTSELFGFRQTAAISHADEGETFTFRQFLPNARMTINVGTPKLAFSVRGLYYAKLESEGWTLSAHVTWEAQKGSTFVTRLKLPPLWEITGVKEIGSAESSDVVNWNVGSTPQGTRELSIEFRETLSPGKKKSVEVSGRRLTVSTELPMGIPVFEPRGSDSSDYLVALSYPQELVPVWLPASNPEVISRADVPEAWRDSLLWTRIDAAIDQDLLILSPKSAEPQTSFYFRSTQGRFEGRVRIYADISRQEITQSLHVQCLPRTEPVQEILVYLAATGNSTEMQWQIVEPGSESIQATLLDRQRHAEWNLPATGELWEIQLPQPRGNPLHVVGRRVTSMGAGVQIPLAFLPQASRFVGQVALFVNDGVDVWEQAKGLRVIESEAWTSEPNFVAPIGSVPSMVRLQRIWEYDSTQDSLGIGIEDSATRSLATLALTSQMTLSGNFDLHEASFRALDNLGRGPFQFELPPDAKLIDVKVDGHKATSTRQGARYVLPPVVGLARKEVTVRYWLPANVPRFKAARTVIFPKISSTILFVDWRIALPPDTVLSAVPAGLRLQSPLPEISWTQRLFGPLGRPRDGLIFNPFRPAVDLNSLWNQTKSDAAAAPAGGMEVPPGWRIWKLAGPAVPDAAVVKLWDAARAERLAWVALLFSATVTAFLRAAKTSFCVRAAGLWFGLCLVSSVLAPPVYAKMIGGLLVGTLISSLVPSGFFTTSLSRMAPRRKALSGSTETLQHAGVTMLLVVALSGGFVLTCQALAQENRSEVPLPAGNAVPTQATGKVYDVLIPSDPKTDAPDMSNLVFVPAELLELLGRVNMNRPEPAQYLISSANYSGSIDDRQQVTLSAEFTVVLLSDDPVVRVEIPLDNVNLGGADACRVNGRPHPVLRSPDGNGLVLELANASEATSPHSPDTFENAAAAREQRPAAATSESPPGTSTKHPQSYQIELKLYPRSVPTTAGGRFSTTVPPVASSRLRLHFDTDVRTVGVPAARGWQARTSAGRELTAELGKIGRLDVRWSRTEGSLHDVPALVASVASLVEAHATWAHVRHRQRIQVLHGSVDFLSLGLPHGTAVRSVHADDLLRYSIIDTDQSTSQLLMEFRTPHTVSFQAEIDTVIPIESAGGILQIPAMNLYDPASQASPVDVVLHQVGVSAAAEFTIQPLRDESSDVTEIAVDKFLENWGALDGVDSPELAFQLRRPVHLALRMDPARPHRTVQSSYTGRVKPGFLEWNLTAVVRTLGSPAYQHVLIVDPRLRITSVSVQEDDAERLLRWSRMNDRLVLFLQDKTTGAQNILLKGVLPLAVAKDIELPIVRIERAEQEESRILLYDASDYDVRLIGAEAYEFGEAASRLSESNAADVLLGGFRFRDEIEPPRIHILDDKASDTRVDTATILEREPGGWNMHSILRFYGSEPLSKRIRVQIPKEIIPNFKLLEPAVSLRRRALPDGSVLLVFQPGSASTGVFQIRMSAQLAASDSEMRQLPTPLAMQGFQADNYLLVSSRDPTRPLKSQGGPLSLPDVSDWLKQPDTIGFPLDAYRVYRGDSPRWVVSTLVASPITADRDIPLMDTTIWLGTGRNTFGITRLFPFGSALSSLELNWPEQAKLEALVVDNRVIGMAQPSSGRLVVPLDESTAAHAVTVIWSRRGDGGWLRLGPPAEALPSPKTSDVKQSLLRVVPAAGIDLYPASGYAALPFLDYRMDRFAGFLEICESQLSVENRINPALWSALDTAQMAVSQQAAQSFVESEGYSPSQRERYGELSRRVESLKSLAEQAPAADVERNGEAPAAGLPDATLIDNDPRITVSGSVLVGRSVGAAPSFWRVRKRWVTWVLVCLASAMVYLVNRRLPLCEQLGKRPHLALAALAVLWWTCLSPSFVGPLLMLSAGILIARDWLRGGPDDEIPVPGWTA